MPPGPPGADPVPLKGTQWPARRFLPLHSLTGPPLLPPHAGHSIKTPLAPGLCLSCLGYVVTLMFCREYEITTLIVSNQANHRLYNEC